MKNAAYALFKQEEEEKQEGKEAKWEALVLWLRVPINGVDPSAQRHKERERERR